MTAVMMEADVDEALDLSDLDALNEPHIFCAFCYPGGPGLAVAACGKQAFMRGVWITPEMLAEACAQCAEFWQVPCVRCGR